MDHSEDHCGVAYLKCRVAHCAPEDVEMSKGQNLVDGM